MTFGITYPIKVSLQNMDSDFQMRVKKCGEDVLGVLVPTVTVSGIDDEKDCRFKNCSFVKLKLATKKRYSVMVFSNGYMQVAGCRSESDCIKVSSIICKSLGMEQVVHASLTCRLINTYFRINKGIDIDRTINALRASGRDITFDAQSHSSIDMLFNVEDRSFKIFFFMKGNIVITGAKALDDVNKAYAWAIEFLNANYDNLVVHESVVESKDNEKKKRGRKRKLEATQFYEDIKL